MVDDHDDEKSWLAGSSDGLLFLVVLTVLFPLFLLTADRGLPYNIDGLSNALSAAAMGSTGSPVLEGNEALADPAASGVIAWVVESPRGPVSKYPPGAALTAAPFYFFAAEGELMGMSGTMDPTLPPTPAVIPPLWPAAVAAALACAVAVGLLVLTLRQLVGWRWACATGSLVAAGTGMWVNAAHTLWQHGAASMWIALGMFAASRRHWFVSGVSLGFGILTRPTLGVTAAGLGGAGGWRDRDWRPVVRHGIGAVLGLAALLSYNYWLWGEWTVSGGYQSDFAGQLVGADLGWYLANIGGGLFSFDRGLFVWSPMVAVAAAGLPRVWGELPGWAVGGLVGGVLLLLLQFRLNRYSGGLFIASYRYPIEAVVAGAPALAVAAREVWSMGRTHRRVLLYSGLWSVALHLPAIVSQTATQ